MTELSTASFSVGTLGNPAPVYQWYRGANPVTGATNSTFSLDPADYNDNGAQFQVVVQNVVSNVTCAVTSTVATLTVIADTNPPVLLAAQPLGLSQVEVSFSERISPASATNPANYSLSGPDGIVLIASAKLDGSQTNVVLAVGFFDRGRPLHADRQ